MLKIDKNIERIVNTEEQNLKDIFNKIDDQTLKNSKKYLIVFTNIIYLVVIFMALMDMVIMI